LQEKIQGLPGVESVGYVSELPLSGQANDTFFDITEHPVADQNNLNDADDRVIAGSYFQAMRIPLLAGRDFGRQDTADTSRVVIVNKPFAKRYFAGENPIGKQLKIFEGKPNLTLREIVGVVGGNKHFAMQEDTRPALFVPYAQSPYTRMNLVVRGSGNVAALAVPVREAVRAIDADEATSAFRTMNDVVAASEAGDRFNAILLGAFGGMALLLTAAGIFGVLSYLVTQRTHEIGLRMALGAQPQDVLRVIVGHGMRLALIGVAIGLAGAFAATRWMSSFLFGVKPTDPWTFAAVVAVLFAAAFLACYFPAQRAMRVDPMVALRYE
jgi:putative ABC transport system permease protein